MYARIIPIRSNEVDKDEYNILYEDGTITKNAYPIMSGTIQTGRFYDKCFKDDDYYSPLLKNCFAEQCAIIDYDHAKFDFNNKDLIFHVNVAIPDYYIDKTTEVLQIQNDLMLRYGNFKVNFHFDTPTGEVIHTNIYNFIVSRVDYTPSKTMDMYYIVDPKSTTGDSYIVDESKINKDDYKNLIYMMKVNPDAPKKAGDTHKEFYKVIFGWQKMNSSYWGKGFFSRMDVWYKMYHAQKYTDADYGNTNYFHPFMHTYGSISPGYFNARFLSEGNTGMWIGTPDISISDNHLNITTFAPYVNDIFISDTDKSLDTGDVYWDRPFMDHVYPLANYDKITTDTYVEPLAKGTIAMSHTYKSYYT